MGISEIIKIGELKDQLKNSIPGDIFYIENGVYENAEIEIDAEGTFDSPIYILPETPGGVTFKGETTLVMDGFYTVFSNFVFKDTDINKSIKLRGKNNRISGCTWDGLKRDVESLIRLEGVANRFDHNIIKNIDAKLGVLVLVYRELSNIKEDYALIDNNYFLDRKPYEGSNNGKEAIRIGDSQTSLKSNSKSIIYKNIFENMNGEIEVISVKANENLILNNNLIRSQGLITLRHGNRNVVRKNKIDAKQETRTGGIRIVGADHVVEQNLIKNVNGDGKFRSSITLMCGIEDSPLNGYDQVVNGMIKNNIIDSSNYGMTLGLSADSGVLKPDSTVITDNFICNTNVAFSDEDDVLGAKNTFWDNNKIYNSDLGSEKEQNGITKVEQDCQYNENDYGVNQIVSGFQDNPEDTKLTMSIQDLYKYLMNNDLEESHSPTNKPTYSPTNNAPKNNNVISDSKYKDYLENTKRLEWQSELKVVRDSLTGLIKSFNKKNILDEMSS